MQENSQNNKASAKSDRMVPQEQTVSLIALQLQAPDLSAKPVETTTEQQNEKSKKTPRQAQRIVFAQMPQYSCNFIDEEEGDESFTLELPESPESTGSQETDENIS